MINYYIYDHPRAYHWFSIPEMYQREADVEVYFRRPLLTQNQWSVFKTPDMTVVPDISEMPQDLPKTYVWEPNVPFDSVPYYPHALSLFVAHRNIAYFGKRSVAYFLGMWPKFEDYKQYPDDPSIWPIRGLLTSGNIKLQPRLRREMNYAWLYKYRYQGRRSVPGGYIPLHFIDECYYLDGQVPGAFVFACKRRGLPWTDFEPRYRMIW